MLRLLGGQGPPSDLVRAAHAYGAQTKAEGQGAKVRTSPEILPAPCREYAERLSKAGKTARIIEYPDAYHQFDAPGIEQGVSARRCRLEEGENGVILNSETKQPFLPSDACYEKGFTGWYYQEAAANKSHEDVKAFLKDLFHLH